MLLSAFFWTYALMQVLLIAGWLVDRFNVCWILAGGFFLWSGATAVTGAARAFAVDVRVAAGVGDWRIDRVSFLFAPARQLFSGAAARHRRMR